MKRCPECGKALNSTDCCTCGYKIKNIQGFPAYSPEFALQNDGLSSEAHEYLCQHEDGHFWFENRNKLIVKFIQAYFPGRNSFCEVGCGTGFVLSGIAESFPYFSLTGSEIYSKVLSFTHTRVPNASLIQADLCQFPYEDEFDLIGAFDVLEHIDNDHLALKNIYRALKINGGLILTVPQHKWLWSDQDELACHKRRYKKFELVEKLERVGFKIVRISSFISFLLPFMYLSRLKKDTKGNSLKMPASLNVLFSLCCGIERNLIKVGMNFPVGGSLIVSAQKI